VVTVISYGLRALAGQGRVAELINTPRTGVAGGTLVFAILPGGHEADVRDLRVDANVSMS